MNDSDLYSSDARSLSRMMDPQPGGGRLWEPDELGAILAHQLSAPLECDLGHLDGGLAERLQGAAGPPMRTFAELLDHPHPPVELLELTKRFAKACRSDPQGPLPDEIATVLYFLSIAAALARCGRRITKMDDSSLRYSLDWALGLPWLDDSSRRLLRQGREAI